MNKFISILKRIFTFELFFFLFLFAGRYKGDPRFSWVPVDLTALFFGLSIAGAIYVFSVKGFSFRSSALKLNAIYLIFIVYALATYLWTPGEIYAREKMLYIATLTFWPLLATSLIISSKYERFQRFMIIFVIFACWVAIETFVAYLQSGGMLQVMAMGSNYLGIGRVLGPAAIIVLIYVLYFTDSLAQRIIGVATFGFFLFLLMVAGGRGPLLATVIPMFIPLVTSVDWHKAGVIKIKKAFPLMASLVGLAAIGMIWLINSENTPATLRRLELLWESSGGGRSVSTRMSFYLTSISLWVHQPFWGYGVGSWPVIVEFMDYQNYPHNIILETLFEFGLTGLIILTSLFAYGLSRLGSWTTVRNNPLLMLVFLIFLNALLNAFISGDIPNNRFLFGALGLMLLDKNFYITSQLKRSIRSHTKTP